MKKVNLLLMGLLVMGLAFSCSKTADETANPVKENTGFLKSNPDPLQFDLIAGQNYTVGTVTFVPVNNDQFQVCFQTTLEDWYFTEINFHIADDFAKIPKNPQGSPTIGQFEWKYLGDPTDYHCFTINYADYPALGLACDMELVFAAHAVVKNIVDGVILDDETAWVDGILFREKGSWATYAYVTIPCEGNGGGDCEEETAFAGDIGVLIGGTGGGSWFYYFQYPDGGTMTYTIFAGQTFVVGELSFINGNMVIELNDPWEFVDGEEIHIDVTTEVPTERGAPGNYLYDYEHEGGSDFTIPQTLNFPGQYYKVHMVVINPDYCD
ncbi:MAG: hypothetical protein ACNA7V_09125 [Bacteroidales bacterium]